jgi:hypothetical protein
MRRQFGNLGILFGHRNVPLAPCFSVPAARAMISEAIFQSLEIAIELKIVKNGFGVPSCPVGDTQDICVSA